MEHVGAWCGCSNSGCRYYCWGCNKNGFRIENGKWSTGLSGGALLPTLFLTMITSLILGMGSPTTANYVITSTIAAPAIILLGVPDLSAHLFVFYFGIIADITPPVALAAFAAAAVSGGEPFRTGVESTKLAISAFIIPYMFVLSPELLMIDTTLDLFNLDCVYSSDWDDCNQCGSYWVLDEKIILV